jgi:glycosyltransferase involved in cell wall biosynthesis
MSEIDVVLIGRNEGVRLIAALKAARGAARQLVYVDSGSSDNSVAEARAHGAHVVELDMSVPFTAARARNAGYQALNDPQLIQFIDGDCALVPGFLEAAKAHLEAHPSLGIVTGWRVESAPQVSVYNRLCDWEWHQPAGPIAVCGGDMMVRAAAFEAVGGFAGDMIAGEDDDFCLRVGQSGWGLERLPLNMTRHDADMTRFAQWWQRASRTGHAFAQVGNRHPHRFRKERLRVLIYGLAVPLTSLMYLPGSLLIVLLAYSWNFFKIRRDLSTDSRVARADVATFAALLTLSKLPNFIGLTTYWLRRARGSDMQLIEYK